MARFGAEGATVLMLAEDGQAWTFDDLLALPQDADWRRYEIVDGALVVSPSPGMRHESVSARLRRVLDAAGSEGYEVVGPMALDLRPSYRIPDLVVVTAQVAATDVNPLPAADALLVVEIVSAASVTTDRITKPAQYAGAGIGVYVRVETRPTVTLTAYQLFGDEPTYRELGTWGPGETAHLDTPFSVDIAIDDITPGG